MGNTRRPFGSHLHPHAAARGTTDIDAVVVRQGKNLKGRLFGILLATGGKRVLGKALATTVKAIEARNYQPGQVAVMNQARNLSYDVFVNDPPPQDGFLPNGEPKRFSPMASTLIYGSEDAVLTDPGLTEDQARALGDWVAGEGPEPYRHLHHPRPRRSLVRRRAASRAVRRPRRRLGGHDHADARQRGRAAAAVGQDVRRAGPALAGHRGDGPGQPVHPEGHDLVIVDVGHTDSDDTSVLHVPDLGLVVAGDVIYNGVHMYLAQSAVGGFGPWRDAIGKVEALGPRHIVYRPPEQPARRRRQADDRGDPALPGRRRGSACALRTPRPASSTPRSRDTRTISGGLILWVSARALYGVREHPGENPAQIILSSWL